THLHDGGMDIKLNINGKQVCESKALYGGKGHEVTKPDGKRWDTLRETTDCGKIKLNKGDKVDYFTDSELDARPSQVFSLLRCSLLAHRKQPSDAAWWRYGLDDGRDE